MVITDYRNVSPATHRNLENVKNAMDYITHCSTIVGKYTAFPQYEKSCMTSTPFCALINTNTSEGMECRAMRDEHIKNQQYSTVSACSKQYCDLEDGFKKEVEDGGGDPDIVDFVEECSCMYPEKYDPNYSKLSNLFATLPRMCWYKPCKDDSQLTQLPFYGSNTQCPDNLTICNALIEVTKTSGDVDISDISFVQNCGNVNGGGGIDVKKVGMIVLGGTGILAGTILLSSIMKK